MNKPLSVVSSFYTTDSTSSADTKDCDPVEEKAREYTVSEVFLDPSLSTAVAGVVSDDGNGEDIIPLCQAETVDRQPVSQPNFCSPDFVDSETSGSLCYIIIQN